MNTAKKMNVELPWRQLTEDMSMIERIEFVKGPAGFMPNAGWLLQCSDQKALSGLFLLANRTR